MTTKQFIEKAIEGGYKSQWVSPKAQIKFSPVDYSNILLDPKAWQAVGKTMGWADYKMTGAHGDIEYHGMEMWQYYMHSMIDALAEGKSVKEFIGTL